jgi:hypothetical protein
MDAATRACAPSGVTWHGINWAEAQRHVRRLQTRIVKATQKRSCVAGCRKMPLARLEPCGSKDPCTVLRGLGAGNRAWLPDFVVAAESSGKRPLTRRPAPGDHDAAGR